ncbi:MAG: GTP pyrophosphokinase family protein [Hyalangium sp.]|uniref:GTP pyrophosphokinase n=1 Tax=Hyalangium sp. TaxID=2028555 RepID=UPI00389A1189
MLKQELLDAYLGRQPTFEALGRALHAHLQGVLERGGVSVHGISYRVKSPASLARKLARPDKIYERLDELTDLVGLRIITFFEDSIEQVARLIEQHFRVDIDRSVDKRLRQDPDSFGYRSLHYICHPPPELLEHHSGWDWPFEIQIRTILQHAWAEIEHDLGYKSPESVPLPVRRRFSRLAGLLEIADSEFVELRRFMESYAQEVRQPVQLERDALELDTVSLQSLVEAGPVAELDRVLADRLGRPLAPALFFPDYVTRMLRTVQLDRPARILQRLETFSPRLLTFAERYFRFTTEAWGFGGEHLDSVQRGYSLVLLAHWQALFEAELELHRVERMKGFYQQLDYPDDEAEARRIARLFVKCFADWRGHSPS